MPHILQRLELGMGEIEVQLHTAITWGTRYSAHWHIEDMVIADFRRELVALIRVLVKVERCGETHQEKLMACR